MEYIVLEYLRKNGVEFEQNYQTSKISSFEIGGNSRFMIFPKSVEELCDLVRFLNENKFKFYIVGNCTNVFFADKGYDGALISTKFINKIKVNADILSAECGALITDCAVMAMKFSLTGMEFLCGIPGSVGGAIFMNCSAFNKSISNVLLRSEVYDLKKNKVLSLNFNEHNFAEKSSVFLENKNLILLSASFKLKKEFKPKIYKKMNEISVKRIKSQPLEFGNCGSTFKRPLNCYASKLIDELGLKGFQIGGAKISNKHAGFIVNIDQATSFDVVCLIESVRSKVYDKTGIYLEQEIILVE